MTHPRSTTAQGKLTPLHRVPTGHETRRSESVMRDRRGRKQARSTRRVRDLQEA